MDDCARLSSDLMSSALPTLSHAILTGLADCVPVTVTRTAPGVTATATATIIAAPYPVDSPSLLLWYLPLIVMIIVAPMLWFAFGICFFDKREKARNPRTPSTPTSGSGDEKVKQMEKEAWDSEYAS